jgi:hypothetical protein
MHVVFQIILSTGTIQLALHLQEDIKKSEYQSSFSPHIKFILTMISLLVKQPKVFELKNYTIQYKPRLSLIVFTAFTSLHILLIHNVKVITNSLLLFTCQYCCTKV